MKSNGKDKQNSNKMKQTKDVKDDTATTKMKKKIPPVDDILKADESTDGDKEKVDKDADYKAVKKMKLDNTI